MGLIIKLALNRVFILHMRSVGDPSVLSTVGDPSVFSSVGDP